MVFNRHRHFVRFINWLNIHTAGFCKVFLLLVCPTCILVFRVSGMQRYALNDGTNFVIFLVYNKVLPFVVH